MARVKRTGPGRKTKLTKGNYRKKALPFLLSDFSSRCAYCLDPGDFRHPSLSHVDHFNCKLKERERHQYANLMLACGACNLTKHDKPVQNPYESEQRLLNCTLESEFPTHIVENDRGEWLHKTPAGEYHLTVIGLQEKCHTDKRFERLKMARHIVSLLTSAINYRSQNPTAVHKEIMATIRDLLTLSDKFPPLITEDGVVTVRDWVKSKMEAKSIPSGLL